MNRASLAAFSARGAALRQTLAGPAPGEGPNVLLLGRRLCLAFDRTEQSRTMREEGFVYQVDAVTHLPIACGITEAQLPIGLQLTYLPTGEIYRIDSRRAQPAAGFFRLLLRRVNGNVAPGL
jgi:hypothetical protein